MRRIAFLVVLAALLIAAPAQAAKSCPEPGESWERATPAEAGMDAGRLQEAVDYGSSQASFAIRVYRHGCLVAEDRAAPVNRGQKFESWSMAKSVTSMIFGRAMTLGLISPDDPVGSLIPVADGPHGDIRMRDLLTMTSGLKWNGWRDYNIFTMPDRVHDALTLEVVHPRGTYFEYAQSAVALLAEAVGRSAGEDVQKFAQRELMDPLGIPADAWHWERDDAGHVQGFYGVNMRPDDFGRLGELMRRGGEWRGQALLSRRYATESVAPSETNGCYGWLIWVNAAAPCVGPTVSERPVRDTRDFPDLPADMYEFAGLFGQRVTVFPTQGILVVRTGQDPGLIPASNASWEPTLYAKILAAVTDQTIEKPGDPDQADNVARSDVDYGFQDSLREPDQYRQGAQQDPLPPPGPRRARAAQVLTETARLRRRRFVRASIACPPVGVFSCQGVARLEGARRVRYDIPRGDTERLRFKLKKRTRRAIRRSGSATLALTATNSDEGSGTATSSRLLVRPRR